MSEQLQLRRGSAAQVLSFTGAQGEIVIDTTNKRVVVQDGVTGGGIAAAKLADVATLMGGFADLVDFNSANTDTPIAISLPGGVTRYRISSVMIANPSAILSSSTFGLFTAAAGGGSAIVASATANTIASAAENTNNNMMSPTVINSASESFNLTTLYFRVQTAQGAPGKASVIIHIVPLY